MIARFSLLRDLFCASFFGLCVLCFIACDKQHDITESTKIIRLAYSENVGVLNPQGYGKNAMFAQNLVFEGLTRLNKNGEIIPSLATSWSVDKSGKNYTFNLRQGVRFSNGEEFNADAVVLNFTSILQNRARHSWSGLIEALERVEKVNDYAIRLVLKTSYAPTLNELALVRPFRFLAPSAFPPDLDLVHTNPKPIGTGAYILTESKMGAFDRFKRNPQYWDFERLKQKGGFYYDEVLIKVIFEPNSKLAALKAGQVDMIYGADEIPTRIFMEVANAWQCEQDIQTKFYPNATPCCYESFCCYTKHCEVSQNKQCAVFLETHNRDISHFCPQYGKYYPSHAIPTYAVGQYLAWVDSHNGNECRKNPQRIVEFSAYLGSPAFITSLMLNSTRLHEVELRKAIALAIDKDTLINAVYGIIASPADSLFVKAYLMDASLTHFPKDNKIINFPSIANGDKGRRHKTAKSITKAIHPLTPSSTRDGGSNSCHIEVLAEVSSNNVATCHIRDFDQNILNVSTSNLEFIGIEANLTKAREILASLGYTADNPLRLTLLHKSDKPNQKMLSLILQAQLKRANIVLSVRGLEPSMYYNALKNGEFEIAFSESWGAPYEPLSQLYAFTKPLGHGDFIAQSGLPNKSEIDTLIIESISAPSMAQSKNDANRAIDLLMQSGVYIPLVVECNKAIAHSRINGVEDVSGVSYDIPIWEFWE